MNRLYPTRSHKPIALSKTGSWDCSSDEHPDRVAICSQRSRVVGLVRRLSPQWVMGCCRSGYVGSTSGVPEIADHLLHRASWVQQCASTTSTLTKTERRTFGTSRSR